MFLCSQLPTAFATSTFRPIDPNVRPATYDTSEELREFILATHLRLKFLDYFNNSNTFLEHLYYGIFEVSTSSRCACNGHAARCNFSTSSYTCNCTHNTMGIRCQQCLPMYNNKPWRPGIITEEYNCVICNCNNHAVSCHYNSTLDLFPESHTLGGGGVCDNCQHNTTGRYCETCEPLYYRPSDRLPSDQEACVPCGCDERGVVDNGDCTKVCKSYNYTYFTYIQNSPYSRIPIYCYCYARETLCNLDYHYKPGFNYNI